MEPDQIYTSLLQEPLGEPFTLLKDGFAYATALAQLSQFEGIPLLAIRAGEEPLSAKYPADSIPPQCAAFGGDIIKYRAWRSLTLDALLLGGFEGGEADPWGILLRLARLLLTPEIASRLYAVRSHLPPGMVPGQLTYDIAIDVDRTLYPLQRNGFRKGLGTLDQLRDIGNSIALALLPAQPIGHLPDWRNHSSHVPLSPKLQTYYQNAPSQIRSALPFEYRLAVLAGLIRPEDDPEPEEFVQASVWKKLLALDPATFGFASPTVDTHRKYLGWLVRYVHPYHEPISLGKLTLSGPRAIWRDLRKEIRGNKDLLSFLNKLSPVEKRACAEGLGPGDLHPGWFQRTEAGLFGAEKREFRSSCFAMDAIFSSGLVPAHLLPVELSGIERARGKAGTGRAFQPKKAPEPKPLPTDPVEAAWVNLFRLLRLKSLDEKQIHALYAVKSFAVDDGKKPDELSEAWLIDVRDNRAGRRANKISSSARLLEELRIVEDFRDLLPRSRIGPLPDRRRTAGNLDTTLMSRVEDLISLCGVGRSAERSARIAIRAFAEVLGPSERHDTALIRLMQTDPKTIDWKQYRDYADRYIGSIRMLQKIWHLSQFEDWSALQSAVISAGVENRDNPVRYFFDLTDGQMAPWEISESWAISVYNDFRSLKINPPHGRADLANTFARNIERLNALHGVSGLNALGRLPPTIGPLR